MKWAVNFKLMSQAKFSIILPVKNGGEYVKECVKSILSQTIIAFNLIVLDNCSNDGTTEWIGALKDNRIILIPSALPLSIEENWGRIKDIPKNEFITLIGHDDILSDQYLQTMNSLIAEYPDASLYQTHFNYINENGSVIRKCKTMPLIEDSASFLKNFLQNSVDIMGTGFMMRSKDYDALGGIPTHYPQLLFADMELWLTLTGLSYKVTSAQVCFFYRLHQSTTKKSPDEKLLSSFLKMIYFMNKLKNEDNTLGEVIKKNGIGFIHHNCVSLSHRVLRTFPESRGKISVNIIIRQCKDCADLLIPGNNYKPTRIGKLIIARFIDSSRLLQKLFLWIKNNFQIS